jgi:hypothetical protein
MRTQVIKKGSIPVRMQTNRFAVDKHFGIHIDTLKINRNFLSVNCGWHYEFLSVPSYSSLEVAAIVTRRIFWIYFTLYAPVMW